jgi:hypothetical protein
MSHNRNRDEYSLTYDQRLLLDLYINFYNHSSRQIDSLYELQNEIRCKIDQIAGLPMQHNRNTNHRGQQTQRYYQNESHPQQLHSQQSRTQHSRGQPSRQQEQPQRTAQPQRTNQQQTTNNRQYSRLNENLPYFFEIDYFQTNRSPRQNNMQSFYENIPVVATEAQRIAATRNILFSQIQEPLNNSCPVTLDRFQPESSVTQLISCGHIFTTSGINSWLQTNVRCPVCRHDIRSLEPITRSSEETKEEDSLEESKNDNDNEEPASERNIPSSHPVSSLTESLLQTLFSPTTTAQLFDISQNSLYFDSSNNQIIFEGFLRRPRI